jgi:thiol-disulfide isomerase/thioredoxin
MKSKKTAQAWLVVLLAALIALSACQNTENDQTGSSNDSANNPPSESESPGDSADSGSGGGWSSLSIDTTDLNGATVTSDSFSQNKLTILNIWATWCAPCVKELPELQKISSAFADQKVQIVGVLQDGVTELGAPHEETIGNALALLKDANADYTVILPDETLKSEFISKMQYFPTTFFIDSKGTVVHTVVGSQNFKGWSDEINTVLSKIS